MNDLGAETVIDSYEGFIKGLDSEPIIFGHSLGGAMTQVLLNRGLGSVGIGLSAATVKGVRDLPFSTLKAAAPALNPLKRGKPVLMTEREFHYALANTMSEEASRPLWSGIAYLPQPGARRHRAGEHPPEPTHGGRLGQAGPDPVAVHRAR